MERNRLYAWGFQYYSIGGLMTLNRKAYLAPIRSRYALPTTELHGLLLLPLQPVDPSMDLLALLRILRKERSRMPRNPHS